MRHPTQKQKGFSYIINAILQEQLSPEYTSYLDDINLYFGRLLKEDIEFNKYLRSTFDVEVDLIELTSAIKEYISNLSLVSIDDFKSLYYDIWSDLNYSYTVNNLLDDYNESEAEEEFNSFDNFYDMTFYSSMLSFLQYDEISMRDDGKEVLLYYKG